MTMGSRTPFVLAVKHRGTQADSSTAQVCTTEKGAVIAPEPDSPTNPTDVKADQGSGISRREVCDISVDVIFLKR